MLKTTSQSWNLGRTKVLPIFFLALGLISCWNLQQPTYQKSTHSVRIAVDPETGIHLLLGQKLVVADLNWLTIIQNFDYKEEGVINKGWLYHNLDFITTLDPRFKMPFIMGATTLSVLTHDKEGARLLYEKAVKNFPQDWQLLYRTGYHYLYEIHDCQRAAYFLNEASKYGAPSWASDLAAKLYSKSARYTLARSVLIDALHRFKGTGAEILFKNRLKDLETIGPEGDFEQTGPIVSTCTPPK